MTHYFDHEAPAILIRDAEVHAPESLGRRDVLMHHGRVSAIADRIDPEPPGTRVIEAEGRILIPGFIDSHLHITGGGSIGAGPISREPEFTFGDIVAAGITTAISPKGADSISRSYEAMLQKARALAAEGLDTRLWSNGFGNPPQSLTESVTRDLFLIPEFVGAKIALSDFLAPPWTPDELHRLLWQVLSGSQMAGKLGIIHVHAGILPGGLGVIEDVVHRYDFTGTDENARHGASRSVGGHFQITHCNWNEGLLDETMRVTRLGGYADITAGMPDRSGFGSEIPGDEAIMYLLREGVDASRITISSDAGGNEAYLDEFRRVETLIRLIPPRIDEVFRNLIVRQGLSVGQAVRMASTNVAEMFDWPYKGRVMEGGAADLVLLDADYGVASVITAGRLVVEDGRVLESGLTSGDLELVRRTAREVEPA